MATGKELANAACPFLGRLYSDMDCQTFVENALSKVGIKINLPGSNSWYREVMKNGWVGSPEECVKKYGKIPVGAFLFILEKVTEGTPEKFRYDGIGDATHIGIYTGMTGEQMVDIAVNAGNQKAVNYNFGDGAIHSSSSREHVATSKFKGNSIKGGWNRVGLWNRLDLKIDSGSESTPAVDPDPEPASDPGEECAVVWASGGSTVNIRKQKSTSSKLVERVPIGETVKILKQENDWSRVAYTDKAGAVWCGWMKNDFLKFETSESKEPAEAEDVTGLESGWIVSIPFDDYEKAKALLTEYPNGWIDSAVG